MSSHPCSVFRCSCRGFKQQKWASNKCSNCFHWVDHHVPNVSSPSSQNHSGNNSLFVSPLLSPASSSSLLPFSLSPLPQLDRKRTFIPMSPSHFQDESPAFSAPSSPSLPRPSLCSPYPSPPPSSASTPVLSPFVFNFDPPDISAGKLVPARLAHHRRPSVPNAPPPPKRPAPTHEKPTPERRASVVPPPPPLPSATSSAAASCGAAASASSSFSSHTASAPISSTLSSSCSSSLASLLPSTSIPTLASMHAFVSLPPSHPPPSHTFSSFPSHSFTSQPSSLPPLPLPPPPPPLIRPYSNDSVVSDSLVSDSEASTKSLQSRRNSSTSSGTHYNHSSNNSNRGCRSSSSSGGGSHRGSSINSSSSSRSSSSSSSSISPSVSDDETTASETPTPRGSSCRFSASHFSSALGGGQQSQPTSPRCNSISSISSFKSDYSPLAHDEVPLPVMSTGVMMKDFEGDCASTPLHPFASSSSSSLETPRAQRSPVGRMSKGMQESRSVLARLLRQAKAPPLPPLPSLNEFNHAMLSMLALRLPPPELVVDSYGELTPRPQAVDRWTLVCRHCTLENVVRADQQALWLCQACSQPLEDSEEEDDYAPSTGDEPRESSGNEDEFELVSSEDGSQQSGGSNGGSARGSIMSARGSVFNSRARTLSNVSFVSDQQSTKPGRHRTTSNASSIFSSESLASPAARARSESRRSRARSMEAVVSTSDEIVSDICSLHFVTRQPFFDPYIRRENYLLHLNDSFSASLTCIILPGIPEIAGVWAESMLGEYRYASMRSYFETFHANEWGLTILNPHLGGVDSRGERYLTQLMQVLAQISDSSSIVLLGFSMGGRALLQFMSESYAKYASRIKGLILLDASSAQSQDWIDTLRKFKPKTLFATSTDFGYSASIAGVEQCAFVCPHGRLPTKALTKVTNFFEELSSSLFDLKGS